MIAKVLEVRDKATFLPVIAIKLNAAEESSHKARYLLRRVGYGDEPYVLLTRAASDGQACNYDPYGWGDRTMHVAHLYICDHLDELDDGDVVDVEFIIGESKHPKVSEQYTSALNQA